MLKDSGQTIRIQRVHPLQKLFEYMQHSAEGYKPELTTHLSGLTFQVGCLLSGKNS